MSKFVFTGEDHTRPPHLSPLIVFGGDPCADNATTRKCNSVRAVLFNDGSAGKRRGRSRQWRPQRDRARTCLDRARILDWAVNDYEWATPGVFEKRPVVTVTASDDYFPRRKKLCSISTEI